MPRWFRRTYRKWAKHQLERRGYLEFIAHRPAHAYAPDFSDLWFLYKIVRRRKPTWILEFGSGCSTVILAQALWDNERESVEKSSGHLYRSMPIPTGLMRPVTTSRIICGRFAGFSIALYWRWNVLERLLLDMQRFLA